MEKKVEKVVGYLSDSRCLLTGILRTLRLWTRIFEGGL